MGLRCDKPCANKNILGFCKTSGCTVTTSNSTISDGFNFIKEHKEEIERALNKSIDDALVKAIVGAPQRRLKRRIVYRGEVYNALEAARVNSLDGILTDPYKEGFHDGLKRAIQILANEVEDAHTIIPAEPAEEGE